MGLRGPGGREGQWLVGAPRCGGGWQGADQDSVHVCLHQAHLLQYLRIQFAGWHVVDEWPHSRAAAATSSSNSLAVWANKRGMPIDFAKANMTNALVNICLWDICPFSLVEGAGFENVI